MDSDLAERLLFAINHLPMQVRDAVLTGSRQ
jgi:hypothetical protein